MFDRCNPAPTFEGAGTAFLALELSGRCWLVALHAPDADKVECHRLAAGAAAELLSRGAPRRCRPVRPGRAARH
jgi:transposase